MIITFKQAGMLILLAFYCLQSTAQAGDAAGKVIYLQGDAWVEQTFSNRDLESGSIVYSGDNIRTG